MRQSSAFINAWRNVLRQVGRSRAALFAIVFGMAAMILAAGFIDWNLRFGRDNTIRSQLGHVQLMKPGFIESGRADPFAYVMPPATPADTALVQQLPGFAVSAPRLLISGLASSGEITISFIGEGVDPQAESVLSDALRFPQGRGLVANEPRSVIVGQGLAKNLQIGLHQPLVLIATTQQGGINAVEAKVVGIFESITQAYDDVALRIPIDLARELLRVDGEHLRLILLQDTEYTSAAEQQLKQSLSGQDFDVVRWEQLADFYNKSAALLSRQVGVIHFIIGVIIVLSISNTMMMVVMERVGEIGTMMALGTTRRGVLAMFMIEGCILGVLGVLAGLAVGIVLSLLISLVGIPMPPGPGMAWGFEAGILLSVHNLLTASAIAFGTTILASIYPAWRASRLEIVDALRARL